MTCPYFRRHPKGRRFECPARTLDPLRPRSVCECPPLLEAAGHSHTLSAGHSPDTARKWSWIVSWIVPYVGVFALLLTAAFIMEKAVLMAGGGDATMAEIFRGTVGLATLLLGVTVAARIPRLTKSSRIRLAAASAGALSVALCLLSWGAFDNVVEDIVPVPATTLVVASAAVILLSWFFATTRPEWGAKPMVLLGTAGVAVFAAGIIWENRHGPIWPLFVATAAFLYLWLLAALLLDLIVAWHFYIKLSAINERIREITGVVGPDGKAVVGAEEQVAT